MKFSKDSPVSCFENEYLVCSLRILEMHFYIRFLLFLAFDIIEMLYFNRHINICHCFRAIKGKVIEENNDILIKTEVFGVSKKKAVVVSWLRIKLRKIVTIWFSAIDRWLFFISLWFLSLKPKVVDENCTYMK